MIKLCLIYLLVFYTGKRLVLSCPCQSVCGWRDGGGGGGDELELLRYYLNSTFGCDYLSNFWLCFDV